MTATRASMVDPHANSPVLRAGASLEAARLAVVLLHGRGGSAEDILGLAEAFGLPDDVAYLAPQAAGHTWYPQSFLAPRAANEPFLGSALARVGTVVEEIERAGLSRDRIVIAGFSQGACLSTEFVARNPARYAGLIAFTGGVIGPQGLLLFDPPATPNPLAGTPALLLSGDPDPHVPWTRVEESAAILTSLGAKVDLQRYPGRPHTVSAPEIERARTLLTRIHG